MSDLNIWYRIPNEMFAFTKSMEQTRQFKSAVSCNILRLSDGYIAITYNFNKSNAESIQCHGSFGVAKQQTRTMKLIERQKHIERFSRTQNFYWLKSLTIKASTMIPVKRGVHKPDFCFYRKDPFEDNNPHTRLSQEKILSWVTGCGKTIFNKMEPTLNNWRILGNC